MTVPTPWDQGLGWCWCSLKRTLEDLSWQSAFHWPVREGAFTPGKKGGYVAISALELITAKFCKFCGVEVAKPLNIKNGNTEALKILNG